jgi:hypothetical protein
MIATIVATLSAVPRDRGVDGNNGPENSTGQFFADLDLL